MPVPPCRCAIVGHPVAHSRSPLLYRAAFARFGLAWTYEAVDVAPGGLPDFVAGLDGTWRALSVTAPHKPDALRLGEPDEASRLVGGANTVVFDADGSVHVHNTDVPGVVRALHERGIVGVDRAVIVGAGATARSVLVALTRMGLREAVVQARNPRRAAPVAQWAGSLGVDAAVAPIGAHADCDVVVSTVPAGAADGFADQIVDAAAAVFDVTYDPWPTVVMQAGVARGITVIDGLDLLAGQAVDQIGLVCGQTLPFEQLRALAADTVGR